MFSIDFKVLTDNNTASPNVKVRLKKPNGIKSTFGLKGK